MLPTPIPRHRIEVTLADYARATLAAAWPRRTDTGTATATDANTNTDTNAHLGAFERRFAALAGCEHAVAVPSARLGLELILRHLDLPRGSEVIVPAFNYFVVVERLLDHGLIPVFADVRRDDLNMDASSLESLVSSRTRAILATHMFGIPCDMDVIQDVARRYDLIVIEDAAHATGSRVHGRPVGAFGRAAIFSFSVLKLITTFGGGMVTTDDGALAQSVRAGLAALRPRGIRRQHAARWLKGIVMDVGTRRHLFRLVTWPTLRLVRALKPDLQRRIMTQEPRRLSGWDPTGTAPLFPFQITLGRRQLDRVEETIRRRRRVGAWLDAALGGMKHVSTLREGPDARANGLYYGILADRAEALSAHLFRCGIDVETDEYRNCADLDIYTRFARSCPVAREVQRRIIRLPNHPGVTPRDVGRIAGAIERFYASPAVSVRGVAAVPRG